LGLHVDTTVLIILRSASGALAQAGFKAVPDTNEHMHTALINNNVSCKSPPDDDGFRLSIFDIAHGAKFQVKLRSRLGGTR